MRVFLHLHKCGGTSMVTTLRNMGYKMPPIERNGNIDAFHYRDHPYDLKYLDYRYDIVAFEAVCPKLPCEFPTFCLFRDPVERHWSNYQYDLVHGNCEPCSLEQYLQRQPIFCQGNYMCKWFLDYYECDPFDLTLTLTEADFKKVVSRVQTVDTVLLLEDWKGIKANANRGKIEMTPEQRELLEQANQYDRRLYEIVKVRSGRDNWLRFE